MLTLSTLIKISIFIHLPLYHRSRQNASDFPEQITRALNFLYFRKFVFRITDIETDISAHPSMIVIVVPFSLFRISLQMLATVLDCQNGWHDVLCDSVDNA